MSLPVDIDEYSRYVTLNDDELQELRLILGSLSVYTEYEDFMRIGCSSHPNSTPISWLMI